MGSERFNQALLSLDMPAWAYIGNGVQLLTDGDMALPGTANYTAGNAATLSKQSGAPGYTQCLRIAFNAVANPYAVCNSFVQVIGRTYRARGVCRGDGVNGRLWLSDSGGPGLFNGTTSTAWQPFDVTFVAAGGALYMFNLAASGYCEATALIEEIAPASTRNLGSLGNYAQLGDGVTPATFPTQLAPTHGMSFDGSSDYLLRAEATNELTFTDPAQFSVEALCVRTPLQVGSYVALFCKNGGGGGVFSAPYALYLLNDAGVMKIVWASISAAGASRGILATALGSYWPAGVTAHVVGAYDGTTWRVYINSVQAFTGVAAGCYAPDAAGSPLYVGAFKYGAAAMSSYFGGKIYNAAIYPFALQPGEVSQLYRQRLGLLNLGAG